MTNPSIEALAARCEAATGPDRRLDEDIALGIGWRPIPNPTFVGGLVGVWLDPSGAISGHDVPRYTASLDAALTLVPEGVNFEVDRVGDRAGAVVNHGPLSRTAVIADACTPALALCAAALRAHLKGQPHG